MRLEIVKDRSKLKLNNQNNKRRKNLVANTERTMNRKGERIT